MKKYLLEIIIGIALILFVAIKAFPFSIVWTQTFNNSENLNDEGFSIAVSTVTGDIYIVGSSSSILTGKDTRVIKYDTNGLLQWTTTFSSPGNNIDFAEDGVVDSSGNIYVVGTLKFRSGSSDIFVRKYDKNGFICWTSTFNIFGAEEEGKGICITPEFNMLFISGSVSTPSNRKDAIIRSYNTTNGADLGYQLYNSSGNRNDVGYCVVSDTSFVWMAGSEDRPDKKQKDNLFIKKYTLGGLEQWTTSYNSIYNDMDSAFGIAVDTNGNCYVVGTENTIAQSLNILVQKYNNEGKRIWSSTYNAVNNGPDIGFGITVKNQSVYAIGYEDRHDTIRGYDAWIRKYTTGGLIQFTTTYNSTFGGFDIGRNVTTDFSGNIYAVGKETKYTDGQKSNIWIRKYLP